MAQDLTATQANGTQSTTQNPQTAAPDTGGGTQSSTVQSGTPSSALTSTNGVPLQTAHPSVVPLVSQTTSVSPSPKSHHVGPILTGVSIALFVLAMVLFALLARAEKNTTESS